MLAFLLTTQPGAALVVRYVEGKLPIDLTVANVDGRLVGPLELGGASLALNGVRFEVDRMIVDWRPIDLIEGQVHLESVAIDGVRVTTGQKRAEGEEKADSIVAVETTGMPQATKAWATDSSLKAQRSSKEPPPRTSSKTSQSRRRLASSMVAAISSPAPAP